jgi:hypothetical protein
MRFRRASRSHGVKNLVGLVFTRATAPLGNLVALGIVFRGMPETQADEFVVAYALLPVFGILADFGLRHGFAARIAGTRPSSRAEVFEGACNLQKRARWIATAVGATYLVSFFASLGWIAGGSLALYASMAHTADVGGHVLRGLGRAQIEARLAVVQVLAATAVLWGLSTAGALSPGSAGLALVVVAFGRSLATRSIVFRLLGRAERPDRAIWTARPNLAAGLETAMGLLLARAPLLVLPFLGLRSTEMSTVAVLLLILQQFEVVANVGANQVLPAMARRSKANRLFMKRGLGIYYLLLGIVGMVGAACLALWYPWLLGLIDPRAVTDAGVESIIWSAGLISLAHFSRYVLLGSQEPLFALVAISLSLACLVSGMLLAVPGSGSPVSVVAGCFIGSHVVLLCANLALTAVLRRRCGAAEGAWS